MKILTILVAGLMMVNSAYAGKRSGGGGGKGGKDPCLSYSISHIQIVSLTADSSRRVHLVTRPGAIDARIVPAEWLTITDSAGVITSQGMLGADYSDAYIEGLKAGQTYTIVATTNGGCNVASQAVQVTLPADQAESTPPAITNLSMFYRNVYIGALPYITIDVTDTTAVGSFGVSIDGGAMFNDFSVPAAGTFRIWSTVAADAMWSGSRIFVQVPNTMIGTGLHSVTVQVTDVFGNVSTMTQLMYL